MGTGAANVNVNGMSTSHSGTQGTGSGPMPMQIDDASGIVGGGGRKNNLTAGAADGDKETTYPDWKMELTMERLKQKVAQTRSFADMAKNVRTAIMVSTLFC